jgi:hypothetical protein
VASAGCVVEAASGGVGAELFTGALAGCAVEAASDGVGAELFTGAALLLSVTTGVSAPAGVSHNAAVSELTSKVCVRIFMPPHPLSPPRQPGRHFYVYRGGLSTSARTAQRRYG